MDYGCPINIRKQGESKWGHQDGKNAPNISGVTVGVTELKISTHNRRRTQAVFRGRILTILESYEIL
jgi:hypothetical protein